MRSILAKIQKGVGKLPCFVYSALFFMGAFTLIWTLPVEFMSNWNNAIDTRGICVFGLFFSLICGILFLAAGLYDPAPDEDAAAKPPRFFTVDQNGDIVVKEMDTILAEDPISYKEIRQADGKIGVSMEIHSKKQATEVLAALAIMYDRGDITEADYRRVVKQIREWLEQ